MPGRQAFQHLLTVLRSEMEEPSLQLARAFIRFM